MFRRNPWPRRGPGGWPLGTAGTPTRPPLCPDKDVSNLTTNTASVLRPALLAAWLVALIAVPPALLDSRPVVWGLTVAALAAIVVAVTADRPDAQADTSRQTGCCETLRCSHHKKKTQKRTAAFRGRFCPLSSKLRAFLWELRSKTCTVERAVLRCVKRALTRRSATDFKASDERRH